MSFFPDDVNKGLFVPTTFRSDAAQLADVKFGSDDFRMLLVKLYENLNTIALVLNEKDSAIYSRQEFVNGQTWFPDTTLSSTTAQVPQRRQVFRKVVNFGALPAAGSKSVAHGIPNIGSQFTFTRIYGAASNTTGLNYIPLPYAHPTASNNIALDVDSTNVTITVGIDRSSFDTTYIILEYLKQ